MAKIKKEDFSLRFRVNDEIDYDGNVRIVGDDIESQIVSMRTARSIAEEKELDLVEMQSKSSMPIIKICQFDKMLYELKKNAKKNKSQVKTLKDIQLRVNIAKHDLETKANNARKFIENGNKVRVTLTMKGRELYVFIEGKVADENAYIGRTYRDAPNVDGYIFINSDEELVTGDIAKVRVTGAYEYDLIGELI